MIGQPPIPCTATPRILGSRHTPVNGCHRVTAVRDDAGVNIDDEKGGYSGFTADAS